MASWSQFVSAAPRLASQVQELFEQYGQGLGYLATVRADGGPRVHPVAPVITEQGLFCFVVPSPKRRDLERDGRYALHAFPPEDTNDEAYVSGTAAPVTDPRRVKELAGRFQAAPHVEWRLFELSVDVVMVGRAGPVYHIWRDRPDEPGGRRSVRTTRLTLDVRTHRPKPDDEQ
jgi:hypothetical protein